MSRRNTMIALACAALLSIAIAAAGRPAPTLLSAVPAPWPPDPAALAGPAERVPIR
jgi:hypothetical protein